jgi:hypothetical protein
LWVKGGFWPFIHKSTACFGSDLKHMWPPQLSVAARKTACKTRLAQQFAVTATKLAGSSPAQGIVHTPW